MNNFSWSFSQLNNYRTCPKRWYHYNVLPKGQRTEEPPNEQMQWGFAVHGAMAQRIDHARPLPPNMPYEKWVDWVLTNADRTVVTTKAEQQMAITENFERCDYFDKVKPVWFRCVLDVIKLRPKEGVARIVDWKTGKMPSDMIKEREAWQQLWLSATAVFVHYPDIQLARTHLVYLQEDQDPDTIQYHDITRNQLPMLWQQVIPTLQGMKNALDKNEFPPNPSGLCKRHCAVTSCPHHGIGRL